jgi:UDP-3-O-[3-hydroxymyristoyl] glucosamine N-acyltransferase
MRVLYLCGAGNAEGIRLALRVDAAEHRWDRIVALDDDPAKRGRSILGVNIAGPISLLAEADSGSTEVVNLVARTTTRRWMAWRKIASFGLPFAALISPNVDVEGAKLAGDVIVYPGATVGPLASIDQGSVVFMGGIVGHGSRVGRCCVMAPNAVVNARVQMEDGVYVGTSASILPELKIGAWATIAAGSAVMHDVPPQVTVMGVPAKALPPLMQKAAAGEPPVPPPGWGAP